MAIASAVANCRSQRFLFRKLDGPRYKLLYLGVKLLLLTYVLTFCNEQTNTNYSRYHSAEGFCTKGASLVHALVFAVDILCVGVSKLYSNYASYGTAYQAPLVYTLGA